MTDENERILHEGYNKILLPSYFYMRFCRNIAFSDNSFYSGPDGSSLQFILEELMTFGCTSIFIDKNSRISEQSLELLPKILHNRIIIINEDDHISKQVNNILSPLMEEFNCHISMGGLVCFGENGLVHKKDFFESSTELCKSLNQLLSGMENKIYISINLELTLKSIQFLRGISKNNHSRATLAILYGIFSS
jgi:hypothetical protein